MKIIPLIFLLLIAASCTKESGSGDELPAPGKTVYYISNEGAFGYGNASLSLFYPDDNKMVNRAFEQVNHRGPGDVMQSVLKAGDSLFLVMNASDKVEVARAGDLQSLKTLTGFSGPRYMAVADQNLLALSTWGGGKIYLINKVTLAMEDSLVSGNGPEQMAVSGKKLFVCNSGGFTLDSTVTVVDIENRSIIKKIKTGDNPTAIVLVDNQQLWVLCRGRVEYDASWNVINETPARLTLVDAVSLKVLRSVDLPAGNHPARLDIMPDKKTLVYGGGYGFSGLWTYDIEAGSLSGTPLVSGDFYGFNIHPVTGQIFALESPVFTVEGKLKIYNSRGKLLNTFTTGIGPNACWF